MIKILKYALSYGFFYFIEINYLDEFIFQIYHSRALSYVTQSLANDSMPYEVDDSNYICVFFFFF